MKIAFFGISDRGLQRANNEDHFLVADLTRKVRGVQDNRVIPQMVYHDIGPRGTLLAVADGLGGHESGEIASQIAVEAMAEALFAAADVEQDPAVQLCTAVKVTHHTICRYNPTTVGKGSMSSTLTAMHVGQGVMTIAQVGDSRAYLFSGGKLTLLTEDQTVVRMLLKKGMLTEEEARKHPDRHVILQALGQTNDVTPDMRSVRFQNGDCVLLCTDGLSSFVPHQRIEAILHDEKHENVRCQHLIEAAHAAGGADNVTVLLARFLR
jgi:serine/threonine protein phosphatase PrpC